MKKLILLSLVVFGSLAAQEQNKVAEPMKAVPTINVKADEFMWAKDIIFSLALENQKLQGKKEMSALDLGYELIKDNYKLKAENDLYKQFAGEIKNAKTMIEIKKVLENYGVK